MGKLEDDLANQFVLSVNSYLCDISHATHISSNLLWTKNLLKQQGYDCDTTVYQYNTSTVLLETKYMEISSKRTRHINIGLYFIKDHITRRELNIKRCSTYDMLADFTIKPLQGRKLNKFKKKLMGMNK